MLRSDKLKFPPNSSLGLWLNFSAYNRSTSVNRLLQSSSLQGLIFLSCILPLVIFSTAVALVASDLLSSFKDTTCLVFFFCFYCYYSMTSSFSTVSACSASSSKIFLIFAASFFMGELLMISGSRISSFFNSSGLLSFLRRESEPRVLPLLEMF
jgi:hypothetical protein